MAPNSASGCSVCWRPQSMSSIKRDVKKKLRPRPESRWFLEIQPTVIRLPCRSSTCAHSDHSPLESLAAPSSLRERQANGDSKVNHGSIRGSWPIAISGYPEHIRPTFVRSASFRESYLGTNAGDISVYLPSDLAVRVDASIDVANGRGITSEFPEIHVASADTLPRTMISEGTLNGGGPLLKLHVITGNISIQKIPPLRAQ